MKLPSQKKISREDLKDAPNWIQPLIDTMNSFMENVYQTLNKNITFQENINSGIKEITVKTTASYPTMEVIEFASPLKTKVIGCIVTQAYDKSTYTPVIANIAWVEKNGVIKITEITGLAPSTNYIVRLLLF